MANKTKAELQQEIEVLQAKVVKLERFEKYVDMADEMAAIVEAYEHSGFSREEAIQLAITSVNVAVQMARPRLF